MWSKKQSNQSIGIKNWKIVHGIETEKVKLWANNGRIFSVCVCNCECVCVAAWRNATWQSRNMKSNTKNTVRHSFSVVSHLFGLHNTLTLGSACVCAARMAPFHLLLCTSNSKTVSFALFFTHTHRRTYEIMNDSISFLCCCCWCCSYCYCCCLEFIYRFYWCLFCAVLRLHKIQSDWMEKNLPLLASPCSSYFIRIFH